MRPNKQQRHSLYLVMLAEIESNLSTYLYRDGLCRLMQNVSDLWPCENFRLFPDGKHPLWKEVAPELFAKRPSNRASEFYWFPTDQKGWAERINLLKQCINETQ